MLAITFNACKSPGDKIQELTNDLIINIEQRDFDKIDQYTSQSIDSLLSKYILICKYIDQPENLLGYDTITVSHINIHENKANALVNDFHVVQYERDDGNWQITQFPDLNIKLTTIIFLYALETQYFQLALQLTTESLQNKISLMEQYERLTKGEVTIKKAKHNFKIDRLKIENEKARVYYKQNGMISSLSLTRKNDKWLVNNIVE